MQNIGSGTRTFGHRAYSPVVDNDAPTPAEQSESGIGRSAGIFVCALLPGAGLVAVICGTVFYDDNGVSWGWLLAAAGVAAAVLGIWGIRRLSRVKSSKAPWVFGWPSVKTVPAIIVVTLQLGYGAWLVQRAPVWTIPPSGALSQTVGVLQPQGHGRNSGYFASLLMPDGSHLHFTCAPGFGSVKCLKSADFYYPSWIGHPIMLRYFVVPSHLYPDTIMAEIRTPDGIVLLPYEQQVPELRQALVADHRARSHPNILECLVVLAALFAGFQLFFRRAASTEP